MRLSALRLVALLVAVAAQGVRAQVIRTPTTTSTTGVVVGVVTSASTAQPLAYADIALTALDRAVLADQNGRFVVRDVPVGATELRVRRLGFSPMTVMVTVRGDGADTVRVSLAPLAIRLSDVRVSASVCPGSRDRTDSAVAAILQQVHMNAERAALLARQYPFTGTVERSFSRPDASAGNMVMAPRRRIERVDTVMQPSVRSWRYAPGRVTLRDDATTSTQGLQLVIPELVDFADDRFVGSHCFRYAGLGTIDGHRMIRVEFAPASGVPAPDVSGTLYLDTLTYQLRRASLLHERENPMITARVESWFRELWSGVPVVDSVLARVTTQSTQRTSAAGAGRARVESVPIQITTERSEVHRLLGVRFDGASPDAPSNAATASPTGAGTPGAATTLRTAATRLSLTGIAYDSLHRRPLPGATIRMDEQPPVRSDPEGRFEFADVGAGAHRLVMEHPMLDSLGISGVQASVTMSGGTGEITLVTPSFAQLWRIVCRRPRAAADTGFVYGVALNARDRSPITNGVVMVTWTAPRAFRAPDGAGLRDWEAVMTNDAGQYAACGIPLDATARAAAFDDSLASAPVQLRLSSDHVAHVDLLLAPRAPLAIVAGPGMGSAPAEPARGMTRPPEETVAESSEIRRRIAALRRGDPKRRVVIDSIGMGAFPTMALALARFDSVHVDATDGRVRDITLPKFQGYGTSFSLGATAGRCSAALVVDRKPIGARFLGIFRPSDIAAIEFYLAPDDIPPQFIAASRECGMFVIWTKGVLF